MTKQDKHITDMFMIRENKIQQRFNIALLSEELIDNQIANDHSIIISTLAEWSKQAKSPEQNKTINDMFMATMRIKTYSDNKNNVAKRAVAELLQYKYEMRNK